jgi:Rps23 Pro-64 3,4-dihydroxylase Tpa1-like proline 4-hydroxylase
MESLLAQAYLDTVYGPGIHVVLIYRDEDDLYREAASQFKLLEHRIYGSRHIHLWKCHIDTPEDAATVQIVRLPQIRFFMNGSERFGHLGVMEVEAMLNRIFIIEERR